MQQVTDVTLDTSRSERIGFGEAVLCDSKSPEQIARVLDHADSRLPILLTRLDPGALAALPTQRQGQLDYDDLSRTAFFGRPVAPPGRTCEVAVVTGGTADTRVAREAVRTLEFHGHRAFEVYDVGVAGLWRLQARAEEISRHRVVIAVAGMDAALPTVLAGLVPGLVIAVPTSTGYGIAEGGKTALRSLLASCAQGLVVVNIDNGLGAACAAMRALRAPDEIAR